MLGGFFDDRFVFVMLKIGNSFLVGTEVVGAPISGDSDVFSISVSWVCRRFKDLKMVSRKFQMTRSESLTSHFLDEQPVQMQLHLGELHFYLLESSNRVFEILKNLENLLFLFLHKNSKRFHLKDC